MKQHQAAQCNLRSQQDAQLLKKSSPSLKAEGSLLWSQESATSPCAKPHEPNSQTQTPATRGPCQYYPPIYA
jgi:hypothetical protein